MHHALNAGITNLRRKQITPRMGKEQKMQR
jgi:hypothetical protein